VDFSPDGTVLATGSYDGMTKFWCTKTWQMQGDPIECGVVYCIRYSPSGELLAIATEYNIHIYNTGTRECVTSLPAQATSLAWTQDGTRLLSGGTDIDRTIREWDSLTWQEVGQPWKGHNDRIYAIAINTAGTLVAITSFDGHVRLWRLSDQQNIGIFNYKDSSIVTCVTFSADGRHILSGGLDNCKISEWEVPTNAKTKASFHSWLS
jgi:WD40 repeat protein